MTKPITRRTLLTSAVAAAAAAVAGCGRAAPTDTIHAALKQPLREEVPAGTKLVIGDPVTQKALEFSGADRQSCRSKSSGPTSPAAHRPWRRSAPARSTSARSPTSRRSTRRGPGCPPEIVAAKFRSTRSTIRSTSSASRRERR